MFSAAESKKSKLSTCSNDKETQSTSSDPSEHSSSAKEENTPVMLTEAEKGSKDTSSDKEQKLGEGEGDESIASKQTSAHNDEVKEEERDIKSQTDDSESTTRKNTEDLS